MKYYHIMRPSCAQIHEMAIFLLYYGHHNYMTGTFFVNVADMYYLAQLHEEADKMLEFRKMISDDFEKSGEAVELAIEFIRNHGTKDEEA